MDRIITKEELKDHDGTKAPAWVAIDGVVYDVSKSFQWIHGKHQDQHWSGIDLTGELRDAPHGPEMLEGFPVVGKLQG